MADNSVGSAPSASGQNEYNAGHWVTVYSHRTSRPGRAFWDPAQSDSGSGTAYSRSVETIALPDVDSMWIECIQTNTTNGFRLYREGLLVFQYNYPSGPYVHGSVELVSHTTFNNGGEAYGTSLRFILKLDPGVYTFNWDWHSSGPPTFHGATGFYTTVKIKGQTNIPAGEKIKVWDSSFSDFVAPKSYDDGLPISLSTSARVGWDEEA